MGTMMFLPLFPLLLGDYILGAGQSELTQKNFEIKSEAFRNDAFIPVRYSSTRKGCNVSPPLEWENVPDGTESLALIVEDTDAPFVITHWILYNIPADQSGLPEGIPKQKLFTDGMIQGKNIFYQNAYIGPSPPFGKHHYHFNLYALDTQLKPDPSMNRKKLLKAMEGHTRAKAQLIGCYSN